MKKYFNTEGFERWRKIYGETEDVNKVQLDIRTVSHLIAITAAGIAYMALHMLTHTRSNIMSHYAQQLALDWNLIRIVTLSGSCHDGGQGPALGG